MAKTSGDSLPELELHNVQTRERLTDTVAELQRKLDVPARWRLLRARTLQQMHRDPVPLVAMIVTAGIGVVAIVGGAFIGRSDGGHLEAAAQPTKLPKPRPKIPKSKKQKH